MKKPKYIFNGGNASHPCKGLTCTIGWEFETNSNYVMVYFDKDPRNLGFDICHKDNLQEIEE